jgi:hypothetical protein
MEKPRLWPLGAGQAAQILLLCNSASLKPSGRVVMAGSLDIVARKLGAKDARSMPWSSLRYEHLVALKAVAR